MTQLIIVDDNPRDRGFLCDTFKQFKPIAAANAKEAVAACDRFTDPWLVTDIQMPETNGIELAKQVWSKHAGARLLFWSQHSDETYVRALAKIIPPETVYGYVLKNNSADILLRAAQSVFEDCQCWIDPLIRRMRARGSRRDDKFTDAEYEVLIDIALGMTDLAIAQRRFLSRRGVQNRLQSLYTKLGANITLRSHPGESELHNVRTRAVSLAFQRGLINAYELKRQETLLGQWLQSLIDRP